MSRILAGNVSGSYRDLRIRRIQRVAAVFLFSALILGQLAVIESDADPAATTSSCPDGWYTKSNCKYAKGKVEAHCIQSCTQRVIDTVKWRGGTASQNCDPANNIVKWRITKIWIHRSSDGQLKWNWGPGSYHTNCNVDAQTFSQSPGITIGANHHVHWNLEIVASNGVITPMDWSVLLNVNGSGCAVECPDPSEVSLPPIEWPGPEIPEDPVQAVTELLES
jgi:hypothetical protein